jgi:hypothetical protein
LQARFYRGKNAKLKKQPINKQIQSGKIAHNANSHHQKLMNSKQDKTIIHNYWLKFLNIFLAGAIALGSFLNFGVDLLSARSNAGTFLSPEIKADKQFTSIAVEWLDKIENFPEHQMQIRFRQDDKWTRWYAITPSADYFSADRAEAFFSTNLSSSFQYTISNFEKSTNINDLTAKIKFTPIHHTASKTSRLSAAAVTDNSNTKFFSRTSWGADESLRVKKNGNGEPISGSAEEEAVESNAASEAYQKFLEDFKDELKITRRVEENEKGEKLIWPLEYPDKIRKIFVHHTASSNNLDNPAQAIRDIYYWHTVSRKWGDIGYNYLIDQYGNVYEGRSGGESVVGAHVSRGNQGSIGIALLGNFQNEEISDFATDSLVDLIAEKAKSHKINPTGSSSFRGVDLPNIIGHRDYGKTACPGEKLYARLPEIRQMVAKKTGVISDSPDITTVSNKQKWAYKISTRPKNAIQAFKGERFNFRLRLRNTGAETWYQGGGKNRVTIANDKNELVGVLSESMVQSGEVGTFFISDITPEHEGDFTYRVRPVIDRKENFDNTHVVINLQITGEPYKARITAVSDNRLFRPGETKLIWVEYQNQGSKTWNGYGDDGFKINYVKTFDMDIKRVSLFPNAVRPGETGKLTMLVTAPLSEGQYPIRIQSFVEEKLLMKEFLNLPIVVSNDPSTQVPNPIEPNREEVKKAPQAPNVPLASANSQFIDRNIRIALSFKGNPLIGGNGPFDIYADSKKVMSLDSGESVEVSVNSAGFALNKNGQAISVTAPPRFIPGLQTILEIKNFENRPAWNAKLNDNRYRGILEVINEDGVARVINELPMESYLRGLGEVSNSAHPEKAKALMVAARTYAYYYTEVDRKFPGKSYDLDDNPDVSQKYLGYGLEVRSQNVVQAIKATEGEVVTYQGKLVKTPYFNQSAGRTLSAQEKWGWKDTPYLVSVADTYCKETQLLGHGVGLSGCGATGMAEAGKTYDEILKYFYTGIEISQRTNK